MRAFFSPCFFLYFFLFQTIFPHFFFHTESLGVAKLVDPRGKVLEGSLEDTPLVLVIRPRLEVLFFCEKNRNRKKGKKRENLVRVLGIRARLEVLL